MSKCKAAPAFLIILFLIQFSTAFMLGAGIDRYSTDGVLPFWIGAAGTLLSLFLALLSIPFYARNGQSFAIKKSGSITNTTLFICSICIGLCLSFTIFRPIEYAFPRSWVSLPGWSPLVTILVCVFADCLFYFAGQKSKNPSGVQQVELGPCESPLQNALIKFAPYFFVSYMFLILAPYYTARIPVIGELLVSSYSKILFRLLTTVYFLGYSLAIGLAFKKPLHLGWTLSLSISLFAFLLAWLFLPNAYSYAAVGKMGSVTFTTSVVGFDSMLISFGLYAVEILIFLSAVSWLPNVVRSRKTIILVFTCFVGFILFACAFSFFYELDQYKKAISGNGGKSISSLFHHKNEFGAMLFLGSLSSVFLFHYVKARSRYFFLACTGIFLIFSIFVRCYTGLVPAIFLVLGAAFFDLTILFKKRKIVFWSVLASLVAILTAFGAMVFVAPIRDNIPFFSSIFKNLEAIEHEILSRTGVWNAAPHLIIGTSIFIGKTDPVANGELIAYLQMYSIVNLNDYHSAFVSFYTNHGTIGLFLYVLLIVWVFKRCISFKQSNRRFALLLVILLASSVLFSMPESYTLFINMSGLAFPSLLLFVVFLPYFGQEKEVMTYA